MANDNFILTQEGKEKLEEELHYLETEKRAEIGERIKVAREFGDISENSEYDDAKNEQGMMEARIAEISRILSEATVVSTPKRSSKVNIGSTVTVDMNGATEIPQEALEAMAGKDVALVVELEDNVQWTIRGEDLAQADAIEDLDLGVTLDTHGIPSQVVDTVAGDGTVVQFTLAHEGAFGFPMTLTVPLGRDNAGAWANLYHYNEDAAAMDLEASVRIAADGTAAFPLTHASQYAVVIDESNHSQGSGEQHPFTDVSADAWYAQAVQYVYENGLMDGIENNQFAPEHTTTRAQLVTILYRLEGQPAVTGESGFTDVEADTWYTDAVVWAAANGIVNGVSDTRFAPGEEITRQQMAAILYRYAEAKGYDVTASADLSGHPDAETIQAYAQIPMAWACAQGLLQGFEDDTLRPAGNATRAQIATILMRFCQTVAQ